jgi:hypothetical protein
MEKYGRHMGKYGGHMGKNGEPIYDLGHMGNSLKINSGKIMADIPQHAKDLAAGNGHLETVKLLLERAKDKNPADKDGWTPLHSAARLGHIIFISPSERGPGKD